MLLFLALCVFSRLLAVSVGYDQLDTGNDDDKVSENQVARAVQQLRQFEDTDHVPVYLAELQRQLSDQEARIKSLEAKDKTQEKLINKLLLDVDLCKRGQEKERDEFKGKSSAISNNIDMNQKDRNGRRKSVNADHVKQKERNFRRKFALSDHAKLTEPNSRINLNISEQRNSTGRRSRRNSIEGKESHLVKSSSPQKLTTRQSVETVAFTAYLDHNIDHMTPGYTIRLNAVLLNEGNGFNPHSGIFTAPIAGIYMFNFHFNAYQYTGVGLVVDGNVQVHALAHPLTDSHHTEETMSGNTAIVRLSAGQAVWLEDMFSTDGQVVSAQAYRLTTFSGFLLY